MLVPVLNENGNDLVAARSKCGMSRVLQRDDYKLLELNGSWGPALAIDPTVQPVNMAIGAASRRDFRCTQNNSSQNLTTINQCTMEQTCRANGIALARIARLDCAIGGGRRARVHRWRVVRRLFRLGRGRRVVRAMMTMMARVVRRFFRFGCRRRVVRAMMTMVVLVVRRLFRLDRGR